MDNLKKIYLHKNLKPIIGVTAILCSMIHELAQAKKVFRESNEV
jgi:hypothetical protein